MAKLTQGSKIRGSDGCGVFFHKGAFVVEHHRAMWDQDSVVILWRSEPCQSREEATELVRQYRTRYSNE